MLAIPAWRLTGLVVPVRVRHVYAADRISVQLIDERGAAKTGDDFTLQLYRRAKVIQRPQDPPLLALRLFDPTGENPNQLGPGPCPKAAACTRRLTDQAAAAVAHVPVADRNGWLNSLGSGSVEIGDLYCLPKSKVRNSSRSDAWLRLSEHLDQAGFLIGDEP